MEADMLASGTLTTLYHSASLLGLFPCNGSAGNVLSRRCSSWSCFSHLHCDSIWQFIIQPEIKWHKIDIPSSGHKVSGYCARYVYLIRHRNFKHKIALFSWPFVFYYGYMFMFMEYMYVHAHIGPTVLCMIFV